MRALPPSKLIWEAETLDNNTTECTYKQGALPGCSALGLAVMPSQASSQPAYESEEALSRGTLFPGLDLPFMNIVNKMPAKTTPLRELMALDFVCNELALYLDTHAEDTEAFATYQSMLKLYEEGRNTSFSNKEIKNLVRRFMPELFDSEFDQMKRIAGELASNLVERLARDCQSTADSEALTAQLQHFVRDYSFIQYAYVTDVKGHSTAIAISDPGDQKGYKAFPIGFDYSNREWFLQPMRTGKLHITNVHQSQVTGQLIITVSTVITDANDEIIGVLGADIQLEEIIRRAESLEAEVPNSEEE